MGDYFEIPVSYKNRELLFPASLISTGYSYKILVDVFGNQIAFEPDEERNFRAVINNADLDKQDKIDRELLKEITKTLEILFKK